MASNLNYTVAIKIQFGPITAAYPPGQWVRDNLDLTTPRALRLDSI